MELAHLLAFAGGVAVGVILALLFSRGRSARTTRTERFRAVSGDLDPSLQSAACQDGQITVAGEPSSTVDGLTLVQLHSVTVDTLPDTLPPEPPDGALEHGTSFPFSRPADGSSGYVLVWAEYRGYGVAAIAYECTGSNGMRRFVPNLASGVLDAIPKSLRLEPGPATPGAAGGPVAELVGALTGGPPPVLRYVAEDSTPAEPLWRGLGGSASVFEATLSLMHRTGGVGAVLAVTAVVGGQRVRLTWVTSDWRVNAPNRLRCESDEAGLPVVAVGPA